MKALGLFAVLCAALAAPAFAAEDTSRTYAKPACSERNANPENCVIQDGPPRRMAFPTAEPPQPKPAPKPPTPAGGGNVTILGGGNANQGGR
jgi:hypothetical protein